MMEVAASSHDGFGSSLPQILLGGVENEGVSYRFIGRDNSPTPSPRPSPSVSRKVKFTEYFFGFKVSVYNLLSHSLRYNVQHNNKDS